MMTDRPPSIVLALADKVGRVPNAGEGYVPWSWFIGKDHIEIVFTNGKKIRFDSDQIVDAFPKQNPENIPIIHNPRIPKLSVKKGKK